MRVFLSDFRPVLGALVVALTLAAPVQAQQSVVSKTVTVGSARAALVLELSGGGAVSIAFSDGEVRIGGSPIGSYGSGDSLESAWRSLLAVAAALDNESLRTALVGWSPPSGLNPEAAAVALRIDETLEASFASAGPAIASAVPAEVETVAEALAPAAPEAYESVVVGDAIQDGISGRTLGSLLMRMDLLSSLSGDIDGFDADGMRVLIGEDLRVEAGTEIGAPLILIDGDLEVAGLISHDLIAIGSQIHLMEGGRIEGRLHLADSELLEEGGLFSGQINRIDVDNEELDRAVRSDVRDRTDVRSRRGGILSGPLAIFGNFGRALSGVLRNLMLLMILGISGGAVVHFAPANLDAVAESARRAPARALTVGMAGTFMLLPAFVLGIIGLAISIIGIPGLLLWVPFFPVAVLLAIGLGYVAIARNVGTWVARQKLPRMGWVRVTNAHTLIFGGLVILLAPYILGSLLQVGGGWFGGLRTLLGVVGVTGNAIAALIGFGAVLTTRAGRKPEFWPEDDLFSSRPERPRHRRSAEKGWDPTGFAASTASAKGTTPADVDAEIEVEVSDEVTEEASTQPEKPAKKPSTKQSTTKKASTKKATTKKTTTKKTTTKKAASKKATEASETGKPAPDNSANDDTPEGD